jgi:hypothetical protein
MCPRRATRGAAVARMASSLSGESGSIVFSFFCLFAIFYSKAFYKIFSQSFGSVLKTFFATYVETGFDSRF